MVVDCHTHVWAWPGHLSEEFVAEANARARGYAMDLHVPPERHWQAMSGVERAIVFGLRASYSGVLVPNEYIAEYVSAHPEKLIGFAGVDPTVDNVRETLERALELRLRGVKLGPVYQNIHPMDPRLLEVYEFCQWHGLPVMIHQGTTFPRRAPLKYALPLLLEDVALQFPGLKIVIAHLGQPWIEDTIVLIRKQPNFFADVAALHYRPWQFYNALITAKEYGVLDKLLFGSDYPFTTPEASMEGLRTIHRLVEGTNLPRLAAEEIEQIIEGPTLARLGLE